MARRVKGLLFVEYVKMIRSHKDIDWESHLEEQDLVYLEQTIDEGAWYPMEVFERMGLAIFDNIAGSDLDRIRRWGRESIDHLQRVEPYLIAADDPRETFMRFQILRQALFDFHAVVVRSLVDGKVLIEIDYGMSNRAEEAATYQSIGFIERLLELSGSTDVRFAIKEARWNGDPRTTLSVSWKR